MTDRGVYKATCLDINDSLLFSVIRAHSAAGVFHRPSVQLQHEILVNSATRSLCYCSDIVVIKLFLLRPTYSYG